MALRRDYGGGFNRRRRHRRLGCKSSDQRWGAEDRGQLRDRWRRDNDRSFRQYKLHLARRLPTDHHGRADRSPGFFYQPSDYINQPDTASAQAATENYSLFGRYSYDLNENTPAYVQLIGARADSHSQGNPNIQFSPQLRVFSGNAFLPAPLQAMLTNTNTAMVNYVKLFTDLGPIQGYEETENYDGMVGIEGNLGRFAWQLDYAYGDSISNVRHENVLALPHFYAALDSVVSPTGQIVCYPSLSTDPVVAARYADCVPWNPFGFAAASPAANAYVTGTSRFRTENSTGDITGSVAGNLFELPAGPVSVAMGGTYRTASLDMTSNADPTNPPDATGLRGVVANAHYYLTNQGTANGDVSIKEAFIEFGIPVIKDKALTQSLDLNAAIRYSDYSTTGSETPWKFGALWKVNDGLMVRATRSRRHSGAHLVRFVRRHAALTVGCGVGSAHQHSGRIQHWRRR